MRKKYDMRKERHSKYLLTIIFKTRYFRRTKPSDILAYLIPFKDGWGKPYGNSPEELKQKASQIENDMHGVAKNFASQGFPASGLYQPYVTFPYFYEQLGKLDQHIKKSYSPDLVDDPDEDDVNIESEELHNTIYDILSMDTLYYKINSQISELSKQQMRSHLEQHGNRFVLAELLYYITSKEHGLPDIPKQLLRDLHEKLPMQLLAKPNVLLKFRKELDENIEEFRSKIKKVKQMRLLCLNGSSFFDASKVTGTFSFFSIFEEHIRQNRSFQLEVILESPESPANLEAAQYWDFPNHSWIAKKELVSNSINGLRILKAVGPTQVCAKITTRYLPYSVCLFSFDEVDMDYVKIDFYSPCLPSNDLRPSMILFRSIDAEIFKHFDMVFQSIWNDELTTSFIELE